MANIITIIRIACSIALLFFPAFSASFYILYISAGMTDMVDGIVARRTGTVSELGSRLDSIADLALVAVCLIKLLPVLDIKAWMLIWVLIIALIKIISIVSGYVMQRRLVVVHSPLNKATGLLLFALPFTLNYIDFRYSATAACAVATLAAIAEGHIIRTQGKDHNEQV